MLLLKAASTCAGDNEAGESEGYLAGGLHCRRGASQASGNSPVLAQIPQPQEAHQCWLLPPSRELPHSIPQPVSLCV